MILQQSRHLDGSAATLLHTGCGWDILVKLTPEGRLKIRSWRETESVNISNNLIGLSRAGALELSSAIQELYDAR